MDTLFIFGAKYLFLVSIALLAIVFLRSKMDTRVRMFRFGLLLLPLSYLGGLLARTLYFNPRPFVVGNFTPLIEHIPDNGFPSDHVLLVASISTLLTIFNPKIGALSWVITMFVAVSRVYTGVHHSLDILASMLISIVVGVVIYSLNKRKSDATNNTTTKQ
ncbi:MAG: phosphatase PAP2 family protein [Minisyncoccota bacterium]